MKRAWSQQRRGSSRFRVRAALALALLGVSASTGPSAAAQTKGELDQARVLFKQAIALSAAGDYAAAVPKLRAVAKVKMTAQVAFNLGECEDHLGKLTSSLNDYRVAASLVSSDPVDKDVASRVGDRITDVQARIPRLSIKRGNSAATVSIELDGIVLGAMQLSADLPVDPGSHTLVVKTGDKELSRETFILVEKQTKLVTLAL